MQEKVEEFEGLVQKVRNRKRSGAAGGSVRIWHYASVLGFLDQFMEERPTSSNLERGEQDEGEGVEGREQDEGQEEQEQTEGQAPTLQESQAGS